MRSLLNLPTRLYTATAILCVALIAALGVSWVSQAGAASTAEKTGQRLISIHDEDGTRGILTDATTLREALKNANIAIDPNDLVEPGLDHELVASQYDVNIYRARPVTIVDGSIRTKIISPYQTAAQIASHAKVTLNDEDTTVIAANTDMVSHGVGLQVVVDRATPFTFVMYGKKIDAFTQETTVGAMLKDKNITLGESDTLSVEVSTPITAGITVELWRNGKQTITEDQEIAFTIEQTKDADREVGYKDIKTPGEKGSKTVSYEVDMKNGVEVSRKEIHSVTTKEPKKQVEVIGDKQPPVAGPAEIIALINTYAAQHGLDANKVARIAKCESTFNPNAKNGIYQGLFQHHSGYWPARATKYGAPGASIFDAAAQVKVTTAMMAEVGYGPWECK